MMAKKILAGFIALVIAQTILVLANDGEIEYKDAVAVEWLKQNGQENDIAPEMNVEATAKEFSAWKKSYPLSRVYVTAPESRYKPYRPMYGTIPAVWLKRSTESMTCWRDSLRPGEFYVFQIGVFALRQDLRKVVVQISDLENPSGEFISRTEATCFNAGGVDINGKDFTREINIPMGNFQPLWFGVQIPEDAQGLYEGRVVISPSNAQTTEILLQLDVQGTSVEDDGVGDDLSMAKLKWLNSRIAQDDEVTKPYIPVKRKNNRFELLGRSVELGEDGLPAAITTFFQGSNQAIGEKGRALLAAPISFQAVLAQAKDEKLAWGNIRFLEETPSRCSWDVEGVSQKYIINVRGALEYDGYLEYQIALTGREDCVLEDVQWTIPYTPEMSQYMMGMNFKGGKRPVSYDWTWDVNQRGQDAIWLGGVNGGISCRLTGPETQERQVNVYYQFGPLRRPEGWGNFGKGGLRMRLRDGATRVTAYSGRRVIAAGQTLDFGIQMNLTPVKPLDMDKLFNVRLMAGAFNPVGAARIGVNYDIGFHGTPGNEWINFPLQSHNLKEIGKAMKSYHEKGLWGKIYYTTRETSQNAPEILAVAGLDSEILFPGPGPDTRHVILPNGPKKWQIDNLRRNFLPGWTFTLTQGPFAGRLDSALMPCTNSRWDNLYLEGLNYLVQKTGLDGIYIDDTLNGRISLRRARKILERNRPCPNIDMHSWNHFNEMAGWENNLILYLPLLPYLDNLWIGEARNYDFPPDYWLVEVSGIPFGVPSQMLQDGGNPWRGMLFGMTTRAGAMARCNVTALWDYWDRFEIDKTIMSGFWELDSPVKSSNPMVPVTVYHKNGKALVALGNWSGSPQTVELFVDYQALEIPEKHLWRIPAIGDYQPEVVVQPDKALVIPAAKGYLLEISAE